MAAGTQDHLARAKEYIAQGDSYYLKAADEIIAARKDDPGLTFATIGGRVGKSETWCKNLVRSRTNRPPEDDGEFQVEWNRGSHATTEEIEKGVQKALADPVKRQEAVEKLPSEAKAKIVSELLDDEEVAADVASSPEGAKTADKLSAARFEHLGSQLRGGRPKTGPGESTLYSEATGAMSAQIGKVHVASQRIEDYLHGALGYADRFKAEDWLRYEQACDSIARQFTRLASDANAMAKAKVWDGDPRDVA